MALGTEKHLQEGELMQMSSNRITNQRQTMARQANPQMRAGQNPMARPTSSLSDYGQAKRPAAMSEGRLIRGEVTDLRNNEIEITLEDNTILAAHIKDGTMLSIGDTAAFRVTSVAGGVVTVKAIPKTELLQEMSTIYKALEEAGLPKNDKNIELVRSLLKEGLAINQQTIMNSLRLNYQYPDVQVGTLLQLEKYGLPLTSQNAASFEALKEGAFSVAAQLEQMSNSLSGVLAEDGITDAKGLAELLNIISPSQLEKDGESLQQEPVFFLSEGEQQEFFDILSNFQDVDELAEQFRQGTLSLREVMHTVLDCMDQAMQIDEKNAMSVADEIGIAGQEQPGKNDMEKTDAQTASPSVFRSFLRRLTGGEAERTGQTPAEGQNTALDIPKTIDLFDHPVIQKLFEQYQAEQKDSASLLQMFTPEELNSLGNAIEQLSADSELGNPLAADVRHGNLSLPELMIRLRELFHRTDTGITKEALASFVKEPVFGKLVKQSFLLATTISPQEFSQKENLSECFKETYVRMEQLEQFLRVHDHGNSLSAAQLSEQAARTKADLSFLNLMEDVFRYVQIPLRNNGKHAQAELFVYTKKDAIAEHPERLSVLLHLDMEHLGPLDIHLSMNYNRVESVFYLAQEDEGSSPKVKKSMEATKMLLSEHMNQLAAVLEEKGFLFRHRIEQSEHLKWGEPSKSFEHFLEEQSGTGAKRRYSFDIRA